MRRDTASLSFYFEREVTLFKILLTYQSYTSGNKKRKPSYSTIYMSDAFRLFRQAALPPRKAKNDLSTSCAKCHCGVIKSTGWSNSYHPLSHSTICNAMGMLARSAMVSHLKNPWEIQTLNVISEKNMKYEKQLHILAEDRAFFFYCCKCIVEICTLSIAVLLKFCQQWD